MTWHRAPPASSHSITADSSKSRRALTTSLAISVRSPVQSIEDLAGARLDFDLVWCEDLLLIQYYNTPFIPFPLALNNIAMLLLSSLPIAALLTFATPAAAAVAPRQASASASSSIPSVASSAVTSVASISSAASAASSSGSSSVPLPTGTAWPDPDGNSGRRIRCEYRSLLCNDRSLDSVYGHDDLCLTVQNGTAKPGTPIELYV